MLGRCMSPQNRSSTPSLVDIIRAAIEASALCRLYVIERDAKFPRIVEGVPRSIVAARDGRERVVVGIDTAMEHSEVRVPLDRVVRAEQLDAQHNIVAGRAAGEVPVERPAPAVSGPQQRRVDDAHRAKTVPRVRAGKPVERDTEPLAAQPDEHPTQPAMPRRRG
jgi:hypothetical protein